MKAEVILKKLFATFPNANATQATVLVYVERLASIPLKELEAVVNQCIDESEFLPTIAKIKEVHRRMTSDVSVDKASEGWLSVQKAMRDPATYTPEPSGCPVKFKDPIVARAVEALGWHNLRMSDNQVADRAQFVKFYESFARNQATEQKLTPDYKELRDAYRLEVQDERSEVVEEARRIAARADLGAGL